MIRPTANRLICLPLAAPLSKSPIAIPDIARDENNVGGPRMYRVFLTGPKCDPEIHVGDTILAMSYTEGPQDLPEGAKILTDKQVLAVFPYEPPPTTTTITDSPLCE